MPLAAFGFWILVFLHKKTKRSQKKNVILQLLAAKLGPSLLKGLEKKNQNQF